MNPLSGLEGQVLAGKYQVERVLGQGGMGIVLAAKHIHLEERVAVKLMLAEAALSGEAVARFLREARAAARLESVHVARVSDVGTLEDGCPYMVMEYLDGQDLSQVLTSTGPLAPGDAVDYVLQASEAIAEAHSIGIVHRDLKPSNLFLTRRRDRTPLVKVLDFGISKVSGSSLSASDNAMTKTSAMMGSPLYMSPEQMTSVRDVDGRSDIWALGVILFELVAGSPPFMGDTLPQVCGLVLQSEAPPLSSRRAGVPPELDQVVARCLAKSPDHRFQSVAELAVALRGMAGRYGRASVERILMLAGGEEPAPSAPPPPVYNAPGSITAPPGSAYHAANTNPGHGTAATWGETRQPPPPAKRGAGVLVAFALLVPLLGAGAWWKLRAQPDGAPIPDGSASPGAGGEPLPSATAPPPLSVTAPPPPPPPPVTSGVVAEPAPAKSASPGLQPARRNVAPANPAPPPPPPPAVFVAPPAPPPVTPPPQEPPPPEVKPAVVATPKPVASETKKPTMGGRL